MTVEKVIDAIGDRTISDTLTLDEKVRVMHKWNSKHPPTLALSDLQATVDALMKTEGDTITTHILLDVLCDSILEANKCSTNK